MDPRGALNTADSAARWLYLLAIALAPLFFGGSIPLAWGINAVLIGGCLALFSFAHSARASTLPVPTRWIAFPLIAIGLVLMWAFLQTVTWTPAALHHPIWNAAAEALGREINGSISVNPSETWLAALRMATAAACVWLGIQIGRDPRWAWRILFTAGLAGAIYGLYGISMEVTGSRMVLWVERSTAVTTGPFIYSNAFAAHLVLALISALALFIRDVRHGLGHTGPSSGRQIAAWTVLVGGAVGAYAILLVPIVIALILSQSRAGIVLAILAVMLMLGLEIARAQGNSRPGATRPAWAVLLILLIGGFFAFAIYGQAVSGELARTGVSDLEARFAVTSVVLQAIQDAPWVGFGYGTFADVFPMYRDISVPPTGTWLEAHNAYAEALLGLGIPAAIGLFAAIGWLSLHCFVGALERKRDSVAPIAAATASVIVALHALIDFSIQLQGVTLTFAALLGAGVAQSWSSQKQARKTSFNNRVAQSRRAQNAAGMPSRPKQRAAAR
jgi:O-antigen ligase